MKSTIHFYALHGFLGSPLDWELLPTLDQWNLHAVDLHAPHLPPPRGGFEKWAADFCNTLDPFATNFLIGYSLGGRLALHCLQYDPSLWKGAIFLSTHPGLTSSQQKKERLKSDREWANSFLSEPWEILMERWNTQSVFGLHGNLRKEADYSRKMLSEILLEWSLGKQQDFREFLTRTSCPILWITGENDQKFSTLAEQLTFHHPLSAKLSIPNTSHRILWESPQVLEGLLSQFIAAVMSELRSVRTFRA